MGVRRATRTGAAAGGLHCRAECIQYAVFFFQASLLTSALKPLERPLALGDQVHQTLRAYLRAGRFQPGERLTEVDLSARLGVSRTPVREALTRLASEGLVAADGRGYRVPVITDADIDDIYEVRGLLEPAAMHHAAERSGADASLMAPIKAAIEASVAAHKAGDVEAFMAANAQFRHAWLALVPNPRLTHAVELYTGHVRFLRQVTLGDPQTRSVVLKGLKKIAAALAAGDGEAAEVAMREHLLEAKRCLRAAAGLNGAEANE